MTEAPADPQLAARGTFVTVDGLVQPAPAPRFAPVPGGPPIAALPTGRIARPGADTGEVLTAAGFDDVDDLLGSGAIWQA